MSANAARRTRRGSTASAESEPVAPAEATAATEARPSGARRRAASNARVVAFPEPAPSAYSTPLASLPGLTRVSPASAPPAPPIPREEPAVLHPADRRSFGPTAPARGFLSSSVDQLAIGEIDQTLFDCPACGRPLALGARRCPGCGSHLIRSVLLRKAALFVATGILIGGLAGLGGGVVLGMGLGGGAVAGALGPGSSHGPVASATATSGPSLTAPSIAPTSAPTAKPTPAGGSLPFAVKSALIQVLALDAKLAGAEADLRDTLAARPFDPSAVAATLRTVSAQSLFGSQLAAQVGAWPGAGELGMTLVTYYGTIHDTATAALDNSVRNAKAYETAAKAMARLLAGRAAIDAAVGAAAAAAGVTLDAPAP
jgi:hypothetical protein